MFWAKSHTKTLRKCRDDLDWAMKSFDVSISFLEPGPNSDK